MSGQIEEAAAEARDLTLKKYPCEGQTGSSRRTNPDLHRENLFSTLNALFDFVCSFLA